MANNVCLPTGMKLALDVVSADEEHALVGLVAGSGLSHYAYDPTNPRSSKSYGWKYDFLTDTFVPCESLPVGLVSMASTAAAFAGVNSEDFAECLLNRYEPGAIIQPHLDKPVWEHVVGISLGVAAQMVLRDRRNGEERSIELPPRSMYLLADEARHEWQHSILPVRDTRYSVTFRTFSAEGLRRLDECAAKI